MKRLIPILTMAATAIVGQQAESSRCTDALIPIGHSCTFCNKERAGPLSLEVSFLIWQSKEWGLEFAGLPLPHEASDKNIVYSSEKVSTPDFSWSPGFKIDLGFNLPYDGWDISNRWTYYHGDCTNLKKHFNSSFAIGGAGVIPLWHYPFISMLPDSDPLRFEHACANWKVNLNTLDVDLGRGFSPISSLVFRMHMGAKGCWIRQQHHVEYEHSNIVDADTLVYEAQSLKYVTSHMGHYSYEWGLGPRGGLSSRWNCGWGISMISHVAFSLLASHFDLATEYQDLIVNPSKKQQTPYNLLIKTGQWDVVPVLEGSFGFNWGFCWGNQHPIYTGLSVAYEAQYWWAQNHEARNFAMGAPANRWDMRGDLQIHGLTASLRSDF